MTKIREIFKSVQGEGPLIGCKQLFIRFCGCNLKCKYCDTDFLPENSQDFSVSDIVEIVNNSTDCHSVSLTGGEPLLHWEFINQLSQAIQKPLYLETNGTLPTELEKVIDCVEYIAADIKLPSCSGIKPCFNIFDDFLSIAKQKYAFAKVVFDNNITDDEILQICNITKKHNVELILQPKMESNEFSVSSDFMLQILDKCLFEYSRTRLIPQVHKLIDVI